MVEAENTTSPVMLEKHFSEHALPAIADAMAKSLKDVKITVFRQGDQDNVTPFHFIFTEIMDLFRERMERFSAATPAEESPFETSDDE